MSANVASPSRTPRVPEPISTGAVSVSLGGWLSVLSVAVVVLLMAGDLWTSLLAVAAINASAFFALLEWIERT